MILKQFNIIILYLYKFYNLTEIQWIQVDSIDFKMDLIQDLGKKKKKKFMAVKK